MDMLEEIGQEIYYDLCHYFNQIKDISDLEIALLAEADLIHKYSTLFFQTGNYKALEVMISCFHFGLMRFNMIQMLQLLIKTKGLTVPLLNLNQLESERSIEYRQECGLSDELMGQIRLYNQYLIEYFVMLHHIENDFNRLHDRIAELVIDKDKRYVQLLLDFIDEHYEPKGGQIYFNIMNLVSDEKLDVEHLSGRYGCCAISVTR